MTSKNDTEASDARALPERNDELVTAAEAPRERHPDEVLELSDTDPLVSLEQFCVDYTPHCFLELCAGFRFQERAEGRFYDKLSAYSQRLEAFHSKPLN